MFKTRSLKLERIDTGDYTHEEYDTFLREIAFINRYLGDNRALRRTLLHDIEASNIRDFSVLDVGAGSGELLRSLAGFASKSRRRAQLAGIDLNEISVDTMRRESRDFPEIVTVRADALQLPFDDGSFDYAISSLFAHHLADDQVVAVMKEMSRVTRRRIYVIDLHRHPAAYALYRLFCAAFRISPLVREDGSLSILRSFKPKELRDLAIRSGLLSSKVQRIMPFRIVLSGR